MSTFRETDSFDVRLLAFGVEGGLRFGRNGCSFRTADEYCWASATVMPAKSEIPVKKVVVLPLIMAIALVCFASAVAKALYAVAIAAIGCLVVAAFNGKLRGVDAKSSMGHGGHAHKQGLVSDKWMENLPGQKSVEDIGRALGKQTGLATKTSHPRLSTRIRNRKIVPF